MSRPLFIKKDNEQKTVSDGWVKKNGEFKKVRLFFFRENGQWVHDHKFDAGVISTPASCTSSGTKTYTCACKECQQETIPATGHRWNAGIVTSEPGCSYAGTRTYTCLNDSSHTQTESIPATGNHNFTSLQLWSAERQKRTEATCTEPATYWYECTSCTTNTSPNGDYFSGDDVPNGEGPLGHNYQPTEGKEATCTEAGYTAGQKCTRCPSVIGGQEIPAHGHTFDHYTAWTYPGDGGDWHYRDKICSECNEPYEEEGEACNVVFMTTTDATCTELARGNMACSVCGEVYEEDVEEPGGSYGSHTYKSTGNWISNGDGTHSMLGQCTCGQTKLGASKRSCSGGTATCTSFAICSECGRPYGSTLGHIWVRDTAIDVRYGNYYFKCTRAGCGQTGIGYNFLDPDGNQYIV